jgi:hypothetical protein
VVIPNNDYSRRKFIIGKYGSEDNDIPITYVSSVDSTVNISGNLLDEKDQLKTFGIIMNGPQVQKIIWNTNVLGATNMEHF